MTIEIDRQIAEGEGLPPGLLARFGASQEGLYPHDELRRGERLGQVIVRAARDPGYAVSRTAAGRKYQHRYVGFRACRPQDLGTVEGRQHEIEDHEARRALADGGD